MTQQKIPVSLEILADMETPLSVYKKLSNKPFSYLFESVEGGEKWARYSLIGLPCSTIIIVQKNKIIITKNEKVVEEITTSDPLKFIEDYQQDMDVRLSKDLPKFIGGLVGYLSYDCVRYIEPKLADSEPPDPLGTPDALIIKSGGGLLPIAFWAAIAPILSTSIVEICLFSTPVLDIIHLASLLIFFDNSSEVSIWGGR